MKGPCVVDISHPIIAAWLHPDTHDAVQGSVSWHGHPPNGEYLVLLLTLWHVCSVLQPNLYLPLTLTSTTFAPLCMSSSSDGLLAPVRDLLLESAWPASHPVHVFLLTSSSQQASTMDDDCRLCDTLILAADPHEDAAWPRGYTPAAGVDDDSACLHAYQFLDVCARTWRSPSDEGLGGYENGSTTRIGQARTASTVLFEMSHAGDRIVSNATNTSHWPPSDGRPAVVRNPYEARGVGVLVKALVQQNAGASLFLRAVAVCVSALACFVHSIVVLGERPSVIACRTS